MSNPCLVLEELGRGLYKVAYGSSKKVDASGPRKGEVIISTPSDLKECGLNKPTRFDIGTRATLALEGHSVAGNLPKGKYRQLYLAASDCKYL